MVRQDNRRLNRIMYFLGVFPTIWIALLVAPYIKLGLVGIVTNFSNSMNNPFNIIICKDSLRTVLIFLLIYIIGIALYDSTRKNYRNREEHGSAKWGYANELNKKYKQKPEEANKILTKNVRLGLKGKIHKRNLNVLVIGGSGAGKTFSYCKPNILQANTSFVCLDPKRRNCKRYW